VNEQPQQPEKAAPKGSRTRGGDDERDNDYRGNDDYGRDRDARLKADPVLTRRFEALEKALHGTRTRHRRPALNWSGVDETAVTFESIEGQLELPPDRPTSDLPEESNASQAGG
jgi:hypothetical protein